YARMDKRAFPNRTGHLTLPSLFLFTTTDNEFIGRFIGTGFHTLGVFTPRRYRVTATRGTAFTTAERVVNRVHHNAANGWANTHPAFTTCFTQVFVHVVGVGHCANGCQAFATDYTQFTRG